jgi:KaiC/GvpD/RAD55 family RecA-like ATPase
MIGGKRLDKHSTKSHILFIYDSESDRLQILSDYLQQGLRKNEQCIFVTYDSIDEAIRKFESVGFDAGKYVDNGSLCIFGMIETYLPDGHFITDFMLNNVRLFISDAKKAGYKGVRTAGEMSWLDDNPEMMEAAQEYE